MKKSNRILMCCLLLALLLLATGCGDTLTPYQQNDADGYSVSIQYDANGGFFTTNTSVIVDSYNLSELKTGSNGQAQIALISPDNAARGNDAFAAIRNGHFLAGWYKERKEVTDASGNTSYVYSGKWDFSQDLLEVDPNGTYTAENPVLTLYAAWIPMFQVEFVDLSTQETVGTYSFDPTAQPDLRLPQWNRETGTIEMYKFPSRSGFTFDSAFYDAKGTQAVTGESLVHPGAVDETTGTATDPQMRLYVNFLEGEWYHIYTAEQFIKNATVASNLVIHEDLDFTGKIWPTSLMYGGFTGTVQGNGHTLKNIQITQTNNSKVNAGLFGRLAETAKVSDVTFENVTFTIQAGTRVAGTSYGLLSGAIADSAQLSGLRINGVIQIDSKCYFSGSDYTIGLVCGMGDVRDIDYSGITCTAVGSAPETVQISVDGNTVTATIVK